MKRHSHISKAGLDFASLPHVQILGGRMKKKKLRFAQFKLLLLISTIILDFNTRASLIQDFSSCLNNTEQNESLL